VKSYLNLYIGQLDPDDLTEMIFLDLVVAGSEYSLENSPDLEGMQEDEFCFHLEKLLNKACLISKEIGLKISVDVEGFLNQAAEQFPEEESIMVVRKLIREILSEKGV
jgi:hypothetical protein